MNIIRTERIWLDANPIFDQMCELSAKFWNEANGLIYQYQKFGLPYKDWKIGRVMRRGSLLWNEFPASSIPEYIIEKELMKNWKGFYAAHASWKKWINDPIARAKNPGMFRAEPRPPGFINGEKRSVTFRDRFCKIINGELVVAPQSVNLRVRTRLSDGLDIRIVKIVPKYDKYLMLITYAKEVKDEIWGDDNRAVGIDLGIRYLCTIANNFGEKPLAIPGGEFNHYLLSMGMKFDRIKSGYDKRSIEGSKKLTNILEDVEKKKFHVMHNVSSGIVDWCCEHNVSKIAIGYNEGWKYGLSQGKRLSRKTRRRFTTIPYDMLVSYIEYKAAEKGIEVQRVNEAYTSKCSHFDNEEIVHHDEYSGVRNGRKFVRKNGQQVHADLNGAYNIMRKAYPALVNTRAWSGALSHPKRWSVARVYNCSCKQSVGDRIPA